MEENKNKVNAHAETRVIKEVVVTPGHEQRAESAEFRKSKERLKEDGHFQCWVCGRTDDLQAHHFACEWSLQNIVDYDKLKAFCEEWDPYGYGKLLKNKPITSVDDIRNLLMLCQEHHTGVDHENGNSGIGIHCLSFSAFVIQKLAKENPVPQNGETTEKEIEDVNKFQGNK